MVLRDSLGVPMEPSYPNPIAFTWDNEPIYEGEEVYQTASGDYILAEEIDEWIDYHLGRTFNIEREEY